MSVSLLRGNDGWPAYPFRRVQKMDDKELLQLLANLADAIRDVPSGTEQIALADHFFALMAHLQSKGVIPQGNWDLTSRRS